MLQSIQCGQYIDKYNIETPSGAVVVDCYYNVAGLYTHYIQQSVLPENAELAEIFNDDSGIQFRFDYIPSNETFKQLFEKMLSACDDANIIITNIVEHVQQYHIAYFLKTSGRFSQILFYFNKNKVITHALSSSDIGSDDEKLQKLISSFQ